VLTPFGGGLIAAGALLLLSTLLRPSDTSTDLSEYERTYRNVKTASLLSGGFTLTGALLLLIGSDWRFALLGVASGAAVYYGVQVTLTHRAWQGLNRQVALEVANTGGRISLYTAARVGTVRAGAASEFVASHLIMSDQATATQAVTSERSRISWALRHPLGGPSGARVIAAARA
jgi:hypothetical protein